jgi:hypothetical protein
MIFAWRKSSFLVAFALALAGLGGVASSASATFHLIKVREVFPGTVAQPESDYVELQSFSAFQNQIQFGQLGVYNASGTQVSAFPSVNPSGGPVGNNANNATALIADGAFGAVFPGVTPDRTDSTLDLSPGGGAVCWPINSSPIDCVSWGNFTGDASLPSSAGPPLQGSGAAGAIADGKAISRSITAGCPTLLEDTDDTNNSAANFSEAAPNPRPNSAAVTETACAMPATAHKRKCKKRKHKSPKSPAPAYSAKKHCKKHKK